MTETNKVKGQRPILISICCISALINAVKGEQIIQETTFDLYRNISFLLVADNTFAQFKIKRIN